MRREREIERKRESAVGRMRKLTLRVPNDPANNNTVYPRLQMPGHACQNRPLCPLFTVAPFFLSPPRARYVIFPVSSSPSTPNFTLDDNEGDIRRPRNAREYTCTEIMGWAGGSKREREKGG